MFLFFAVISTTAKNLANDTDQPKDMYNTDRYSKISTLVDSYFVDESAFRQALTTPEDLQYAFVLEKNFRNRYKSIQYLLMSHKSDIFSLLIQNNLKISSKKMARLLKDKAEEVFRLYEIDKTMFEEKIMYKNSDKTTIFTKEQVMSIISSNDKYSLYKFLVLVYTRRVDVAEYLPVLRKLAERGNSFAMSILGEIYYYGYKSGGDGGAHETGNKPGNGQSSKIEIKRSLTTAMHYFQEGANRRESISYNGLGMVYLHEPHKNIQAAKHYFEQAARVGNIEAKYNLYKLYRDVYNFEEIGIPFLIKSATAGHLSAAYTYAEKLLESGNYKDAIKFFKAVCDHHPAITRMEKMAYDFYQNGMIKECVLVLLCVIETGSINAMKNLQYVLSKDDLSFSDSEVEIKNSKTCEERLEKGEFDKILEYIEPENMKNKGMDKNLQNYKNWSKNLKDALLFKTTNQLVKNGCHDYLANLANLYYYGIGTKKDLKSAFALYYSSSLYNHIDGICSVAYCYENGIGCEQDFRKAIQAVLYANNIDSRAYLFCWYSLGKILIKAILFVAVSITMSFLAASNRVLKNVFSIVHIGIGSFDGKYFLIGGASFLIFYWRYIKRNM